MVTKTRELVVNTPNSLLDGLLESTADGHDFTNRLHGGAQRGADTVEFLEIPSGNLDDTVVKRRLKARGSQLGHRVSDLVQRNVQTQLGSNEGKRVTGSLGSQSGRTRETGVDFNNAVLLGVRVERILDVTLSNNTEVSDNVDSGSSKHVVVRVREGLGGGNDDRVTSMDTKRVKVL